MKTFKEYSKFLKFDYLDIKESLDSPVPFTKTENKGNETYLYFNISDKEFRMVIETVQDESAIVFEQKINNYFTYEGFQNNLNKTESLSLFSTLKSAVPELKTTKNYVYTDSRKKLRLYLKILKSMNEVKEINYFEESIPFVISFSLKEKVSTEPKNAFKFKFWE